MSFLKMPRKMLILSIIILSVFGGIYFTKTISDIVRYGYDKQNKVILFVKSIISPTILRKLKIICS